MKRFDLNKDVTVREFTAAIAHEIDDEPNNLFPQTDLIAREDKQPKRRTFG